MKTSFSIWNLTGETSAEVVKLQGIAKGIIGSVSALTWFNSSHDVAGVTLVCGALLVELIGCIKIER